MKIYTPNRLRGYHLFFCPGCHCCHAIETGSGGWTWNGDREKPTISPSILADRTVRCHSFVRKGMIRFLNDCNHDMAGQEIELPDFPEEYHSK